ncbi:MAG: bifunctional phosphopantothenoylcysteine decarboxylase/phosphopantothenate--cysteine ligase CoaBC [Actinobacteria bacterium]|nr:bifunctional phosphopantothenoylcysteine decarboxylase/phosphopantothenate--cysteine ligase CoaBC [Actinomycetota bacterium]
MTGSRVLLGVAGGIAAYKAAELLRLLTEAGHDVTVVPTPAALRFVGAATFAALSGHPVASDVWTGVDEVRHVRIGQDAELVVVAPATADLLARAAIGRADDLLTASLLVTRAPLLFVPAMHTEMWLHPAVRANVVTLRARGAVVLEPAVGRLTGGDSGQGRMPEPAAIAAVARRMLGGGHRPADLAGRRVVITAGGTREFLDPVRFLGNASSGRQGYAFATTAVARGAQVTLISANVSLADPAGVEVVRVVSTEELRAAVVAGAEVADAVVMAAAPADFRPVAFSPEKIKKSADASAPTIELTLTPDIAAEVGRNRRPGQTLVIFAAETSDTLERGRAKLAAKNADFVVVNDVSGGRVFGAATNAATVIGPGGRMVEIPECGKEDLADQIWSLVFGRGPGSSG